MQKGFASSHLIIILVVVLLGAGVWGYYQNFFNIRQINSYQDCINAGYENLLSAPAQCNTPNGQNFSSVLPEEVQKSLIEDFKNLSKGASNDETANWKTYLGEYVSFKYPPDWKMEKTALFGGAVKENLDLGIPGVESDQVLGFSGVSLNDVKPDDVVREQRIRIGGREGFKWLRKGEDYISYDYVSKGYTSDESFEVHVTVEREDKDLEGKLDKLVESISFK